MPRSTFERAGHWTESWAHRYARGESDEERRDSYEKAVRFLADSQVAEHRRLQRRKWLFRGVVAAGALFLALSALAAYFWWQADIAQNEAAQLKDEAITRTATADRTRLAANAARAAAVAANEVAQLAQRDAYKMQLRAEDLRDRVIKVLQAQLNSEDPTQVVSAFEGLLSLDSSIKQTTDLISDANVRSNEWVASLSLALGKEEVAPQRRAWVGKVRTALAAKLSAARRIGPPPSPSGDGRLNARIPIPGGSFLMGRTEGVGEAGRTPAAQGDGVAFSDPGARGHE